MVTEDDYVFVNRESGKQILGNGFQSEEEIKERIRHQFDRSPGEYEYGIFTDEMTLDSVVIDEPTPKAKTMTSAELETRADIVERAEEDSRVDSAYAVENTTRKYTGSVHGTNIWYDDGEVDFGIRFKNDVFDSVPISSLDLDSEEYIKSIFDEIVDGEGVFLGFSSVYASRGHRDLYVAVYGRVKRNNKKDKQFRQILEMGAVAGGYWSQENISVIPIYTPSDGKKWNDGMPSQEYVVILRTISENDSYEEIESDNLEEAIAVADEIEETSDYSVNWIGKTEFNKEFGHVSLGITFDE